MTYIQGLRKSSSFWALFDQAVLSLGTFITNIFLMRAYKHNETEFGVYALLIGTIALLNNLHGSVVTYPLSVRGALSPDDALRRLTGSSLILTMLWSAPLQLLLLVATIVLDHVQLYPSVALALIAWQCQETTRRALMSHIRHDRAIIGDAVSYLGQAAVVAALCYHHIPALHEVFLTMAATSFLAAAVQAIQLRMSLGGFREALRFGAEGWRLGRWLLMSNGLNFLTIQAAGWVLLWSNSDEWGKHLVAVFQALSNLLGVSHPVMFGICGLIVPGVAKAYKEGGDAAARRFAWKLSGLGLGLLAPYFLMLTIAPSLMIRLFCGADSPYQEYTHLLPWFVLSYVVIYLSSVTGAYLNGLEAPRFAFFGQLANAIASVAFRLPLTAMFGLGTAIWTAIITYGIHLAVNLWGLRNISPARNEEKPLPAVVLEV